MKFSIVYYLYNTKFKEKLNIEWRAIGDKKQVLFWL